MPVTGDVLHLSIMTRPANNRSRTAKRLFLVAYIVFQIVVGSYVWTHITIPAVNALTREIHSTFGGKSK